MRLKLSPIYLGEEGETRLQWQAILWRKVETGAEVSSDLLLAIPELGIVLEHSHHWHVIFWQQKVFLLL